MLRNALSELMNQPTKHPIKMTPAERKLFWAAREKAHAAIYGDASDKGKGIGA
jgi:hypothetical protein